MKIGFNELPNECPKDCKYAGDMAQHGQNSICGRCPVFCCADPDPLVEPRGYREDWAFAWAEFFRTGEGPELKL